MTALSPATRHIAGLVGSALGHIAAVIIGFVLMVVGLALGVTLIMLPVGLVVGMLGFAMFVGGLFPTSTPVGRPGASHDPRTHRTPLRYSLGGLLAFGALNAFGGGYYGLAGAAGVPTEWLEGSPFRDYFVPSLILLVVVGGSFLVAAIAVFAAPANRPACGLRRRPRRPGLAGRADGDHRLRVLDAADDGHRRHVGARPGLAAPSTSMNAALRRIQPDSRAGNPGRGKYFAARGEIRGHDAHHSPAQQDRLLLSNSVNRPTVRVPAAWHRGC